MRVVMTSPRYAPLVGGVELHTQALATRLAQRGHDVTVVTTNPAGDLPEFEARDGVTIHRVPSWPRRGDPFFSRRAGDVVLAHSPDLVHAQGYQSAFTPLILSRLSSSGIPTVLTFHGGANANRLRHALYPVQRRVLGPLFRRVSACVSLTRFELALYAREMKIPLERFVTIPNGCDLPTPTSVPDPHLVVSPGRLDPIKGHDRVLEAFSLLRRSDPDARLRIVGTGPDEDRLKALAATLKVEAHVEFVSFGPDERLGFANALHEAGVVISLSKSETQPITLLEAARLGCSVGVTDSSPGLCELIENGVAWSLPHDASAETVAAALADQSLRAFTPNLSSLWTWDDVATATNDLYARLLADRTPR